MIAFAEFTLVQRATKEKVPSLQMRVEYIKSLFEVMTFKLIEQLSEVLYDVDFSSLLKLPMNLSEVYYIEITLFEMS